MIRSKGCPATFWSGKYTRWVRGSTKTVCALGSVTCPSSTSLPSRSVNTVTGPTVAVSSGARLIECRAQAAGEILSAPDSPVVKEDDARLFPGHVLVDGHDLNVGVAERLEHRLHLA